MTGKENKAFVITGVTKGLGKVLAQHLIADGHSVLGCGRNEQAIDDLNRRFASIGHNQFSVVDVSDASQVQKWAENSIAKFGPPDFLINNAAIINKNAPLWQISDEEFAKIVSININGTVNTIRSFVPAMIARRNGIIVNFSSGWGRSTSPEVAPYCATKFAIEGLTQAFASELPEGMAAIALSPGVIETDMLHSCMPGSAGSYQSPEEWVLKAAPMILKFEPKHNGRSLSVR
jgi:NAD(P)-dependent dehydrogenase (short-subunit alcohol dehydrogenase family)